MQRLAHLDSQGNVVNISLSEGQDQNIIYDEEIIPLDINSEITIGYKYVDGVFIDLRPQTIYPEPPIE